MSAMNCLCADKETFEKSENAGAAKLYALFGSAIIGQSGTAPWETQKRIAAFPEINVRPLAPAPISSLIPRAAGSGRSATANNLACAYFNDVTLPHKSTKNGGSGDECDMPEEATSISQIESRGSVMEWRSELEKEYQSLDIYPDDEAAPFWAKIVKRKLPNVHLVHGNEPTQNRTRDRSAIARDGRDSIFVTCVLQGEVSFTQFGRSCRVGVNECYTCDAGSPFDATLHGPVEFVSVLVPRPVFRRYVEPEAVSCRNLSTQKRWGRVLASHLQALHEEFDDYPVSLSHYLTEQLIPLVEASVGKIFAPATTHRRAILRRARSVMRELCHEEGVTPVMVAEMIGVSRSYLHKILALDGTTFCRELDMIRVERASQMLAANGQKHLSINEIGVKCGLPNAPHFARKFRTFKGVSPSQYRNEVLKN